MYFVNPDSFKEKVKVLMLTDNLACGGKERRLLSLLKVLKNNNLFDIELALIDNQIFYEEIPLSKNKIHIIGRNIKRDPIVFWKIVKLIYRLNPAIIHSWGSMPSIYSIPAVKLLNKKLLNAEIVNAPKSVHYINKLRTKISFRYSDLIVSNSEAGLISYSAPKEKSIYIHNGFDFNRLNNLESVQFVKEKYNIKTEKIVGMVGAIYPKKDYITFLLSAMDILKMLDDVTFVVVGDGKMLNNYKELTKDFDRIIYLGSQKNIESIINTFDIGVLCTNSKIHGEGISNSIIEYMALSKPVVATEGGGTLEIINDGINGFICKSRNPNHLTEKIMHLLNDKSIAKTMGMNARKTIETKFSIDLMVSKTLDAYSALLNSSIPLNEKVNENTIDKTKEVIL